MAWKEHDGQVLSLTANLLTLITHHLTLTQVAATKRGTAVTKALKNNNPEHLQTVRDEISAAHEQKKQLLGRLDALLTQKSDLARQVQNITKQRQALAVANDTLTEENQLLWQQIEAAKQQLQQQGSVEVDTIPQMQDFFLTEGPSALQHQVEQSWLRWQQGRQQQNQIVFGAHWQQQQQNQEEYAWQQQQNQEKHAWQQQQQNQEDYAWQQQQNQEEYAWQQQAGAYIQQHIQQQFVPVCPPHTQEQLWDRDSSASPSLSPSLDGSSTPHYIHYRQETAPAAAAALVGLPNIDASAVSRQIWPEYAIAGAVAAAAAAPPAEVSELELVEPNSCQVGGCNSASILAQDAELASGNPLEFLGKRDGLDPSGLGSNGALLELGIPWIGSPLGGRQHAWLEWFLP